MLQNQHNDIKKSFGLSITLLEHQFKDNIPYSQLVDNVSLVTLNFIFHGAKRAVKTCSDSLKCGCTLMKTYSLPRACLISNKMKFEKLIRMDEVCAYWKKLYFDEDGVMRDDKTNISIMTK